MKDFDAESSSHGVHLYRCIVEVGIHRARSRNYKGLQNPKMLARRNGRECQSPENQVMKDGICLIVAAQSNESWSGGDLE